MGFYITCQCCGATEKGAHPDCGCLEKKRDALVQKTIGATVITSHVTNEDFFTFLYTQYKKGDEFFWVRTVLQNGTGEWHIDEVFIEVHEDAVPIPKN